MDAERKPVDDACDAFAFAMKYYEKYMSSYQVEFMKVMIEHEKIFTSKRTGNKTKKLLDVKWS